MWQRFTNRSRRVVFAAQEEARRFGAADVGTEHLLLGITRDNESVAARLLECCGTSLGRVSVSTERSLTRVKKPPSEADMQLTPNAKVLIGLAYEEVRRLENNYVGTEHLLLALARDENGIAGAVLRSLNVTHEAIDFQWNVMKAEIARKNAEPTA